MSHHRSVVIPTDPLCSVLAGLYATHRGTSLLVSHTEEYCIFGGSVRDFVVHSKLRARTQSIGWPSGAISANVQ